MASQYFCGTDCLVYLTLPGADSRVPTLIENAFMIQYQQESMKHPLYGFRDTEFRAVAKGRTIVRGMLIMNREFKNELSYAILEKQLEKTQNAYRGDERMVGSRHGEGPALGKFIPKPLIQDVIDSAQTLIENQYSVIGDLQYGYIMLVNASKVAFGYKKVATAEINSIVGYKEAMRSLIAQIQAKINTPDLDGGVEQAKNLVIEDLEIGKDKFTNTLKNRYWRSDRTLPADKAVPSPDSSFVFDELASDGTIVNLDIVFGDPLTRSANPATNGIADHTETINSVYFEGTSSQISIDDREPNKVAYPFMGKSINETEGLRPRG